MWLLHNLSFKLSFPASAQFSQLNFQIKFSKSNSRFFFVGNISLGEYRICIIILYVYRSLGALRAPTSSWRPFGPRLRPSRPSGAQAARYTQVTIHHHLFTITHSPSRNHHHLFTITYSPSPACAQSDKKWGFSSH